MDLTQQLLEALAGSSIVTVGVIALCANFGTTLSRQRILLWFGLFAAPYGVALIGRSILPEWDGRLEWPLFIFGRLVGLGSIIPALLLFREFYGAGWRLSTRWLIWVYALMALAVLWQLAVHERPRSLPSPGIALVILIPLELAIDRIAGYSPPRMNGRPIIFSGLLIFFLTFSYDHVSHWQSGNDHVDTEPFGFLALTICLGCVVSRQVAANEAEWLSMTDEMRAARRIQAAILPSSMPAISGYSIAARYAPMTAVAGDLYGFPRKESDCLGIVVADVMGHGVPAALIASMVKVSVFSSAERHDSPNEIIRGLNQMLCKEAPGQFTTAVYVSLNRTLSTGRYCAAGHPSPLVWRNRTHRIDALNASGFLLGMRPDQSFSEAEFRFDHGDRLLIYSDGLTDPENRSGVSFGDAELRSLLIEHRALPVEQFAARLLEDVLSWSADGTDNGQKDDITFVVVDLN